MGKIEDLQKLKQLRETGALTEEEFIIEKNKILSGETISNSNTDKKSTKAMVGFIMGLCSIIAWYIPLIGFPVTVLGIIFSSLGLNSSNRGKAIAGLILSIVFLVITCINSIAGYFMATMLF